MTTMIKTITTLMMVMKMVDHCSADVVYQTIATVPSPPLAGPYQGSFDSVSDKMIIAEGFKREIISIDNNGTREVVAGGANVHYTTSVGGETGPATSATFLSLVGVWSDTIGDIFVTDRSGCRVRQVIAGTKQIVNFAGTGVVGDESGSGDGGAATSSSFFGLNFIAGDRNGNLLIVDTLAKRIRKVSTSRVISTVAGGGTLVSDGSMATSSAIVGVSAVFANAVGDLFWTIRDHPIGKLQKKSVVSGLVTTIAGANQQLLPTASGVPSFDLRIFSPLGIAMDVHENIFVADQQYGTVLLFTKKSNYLTAHLAAGDISNSLPLNNLVSVSANDKTDTVYAVQYHGSAGKLFALSDPIFPSLSVVPSSGPSAVPSIKPTASPSTTPSAAPSSFPSIKPTVSPSTTPSAAPSAVPSIKPTASPSTTPSVAPSSFPSIKPTVSPSTTPSAVPSSDPSLAPSSGPSAMPTFAVPEYSLTISAKSFKYFEVRVFTEANVRVFPLSYELVDCPENAGAVIWGHESTPITEDTNTCVYGLPRHYWCECPAVVNGNKPKLILNFGGTVFDRVELLILDWVDGEVVVSDSANNIVLFSASRAGGPLVGEEFVGYDHLNLLQIAPSVVPTVVPSSVPTTKPSWTPTTKPTIPTIVPTQTPTMLPTTTMPSAVPSVTPSMVPSVAPSFTAQYTITLTAKTFKYFEVRVYTHDNLRIFPVSYELEHCPENAGVTVWNEQTTEDTNTCVYGYPRNFWCQCTVVADEKPKLVLYMGHTVFDRVELLLLNWEDGEVMVTDEANHETFLSVTHDGVGNEFVTFGNLNLEHAAGAVVPARKLLRGG